MTLITSPVLAPDPQRGLVGVGNQTYFEVLNMNNKSKIAVIEITELFRGRLDGEWLNDCRGDAEHGEWGIAFENLCTQLKEFDVFPNEHEYQAIRTAGESMEIDPQSWNFLAPNKN
ncbi:MafI family immunity protein [Labrenzia sp. R5_0]|nr:MafI family immunity protein [Labrenzia sp. R5_0]